MEFQFNILVKLAKLKVTINWDGRNEFALLAEQNVLIFFSSSPVITLPPGPPKKLRKR
jgi:hypothetical protein